MMLCSDFMMWTVLTVEFFMAKFTCPSCKGIIVNRMIKFKWSPSYPDGWFDCPYCEVRLSIGKQSNLQKWSLLLGIAALTSSSHLIWSDSLLSKFFAVFGMLVFVFSAIYASSKSLVAMNPDT